MIIKDRSFLNEDETVPIKLIIKCIREHQSQVKDRLKLLDGYYDEKHAITSRSLSDDSLPNNKLVCNHAAYITDMATGYVHGVPVQYSGAGAEELNKHYTEIDEDSHNSELALDISIFGHGLELNYMSDEEVPQVMLAVLSPLNSFLVVDSTVNHNPMFGVSYSAVYDLDGTQKGYDVNVYTHNQQLEYHTSDLTSENYNQKGETIEHFFGGVPVIEYKNNKKAKGDFEPVLTLTDAYNLLQSDRINDKVQLVDALLAVSGVSFGDTEEEMTATAKLLKKMKILELPEGASAEWLVKNLTESEVEVLKKSIKDDIHEFSKVPCLTDENFVGNASGVAMKYKLLGLEQLGKTKERYFKKGLRQRLKLLSNINAVKAKNTDLTQLDIVMKRSLPVDEELQARIAQETDGFISWETRLNRFDPELDAKKEKVQLDMEKEKNIELQQKAFGSYDFKSEDNENESNVKEDAPMQK